MASERFEAEFIKAISAIKESVERIAESLASIDTTSNTFQSYLEKLPPSQEPKEKKKK